MTNIEKLSEFEDKFNPRHFYCRLKELNLSKRLARQYSERYELEIYRPIIKKIKKQNDRNT